MTRWLLAAFVAVAALAALAGPSLGGGGGGRVVAVTLTEFGLDLDRTEVAAGEVRFDTANRGKLEHELLVVRTGLAPDALPIGLEGPALELAGDVVLGEPHGHADHEAGGADHIATGQSRRDSVTLTPGDYVLLCNLPGHYAAGQSARLVVR